MLCCDALEKKRADPARDAQRLATGGLRKVRWSRPGMGKRGGVRVIYMLRNPQGILVLLMVMPRLSTTLCPLLSCVTLRNFMRNEPCPKSQPPSTRK